MSQSEMTLLFLAFVALVVLFLTGRTVPFAAQVEPSVQDYDPDYWETPYYLRVNMPVEANRTYEIPQNRYASWSLGAAVPQPSLPRG